MKGAVRRAQIRQDETAVLALDRRMMRADRAVGDLDVDLLPGARSADRVLALAKRPELPKGVPLIADQEPGKGTTRCRLDA